MPPLCSPMYWSAGVPSDRSETAEAGRGLGVEPEVAERIGEPAGAVVGMRPKELVLAGQDVGVPVDVGAVRAAAERQGVAGVDDVPLAGREVDVGLPGEVPAPADDCGVPGRGFRDVEVLVRGPLLRAEEVNAVVRRVVLAIARGHGPALGDAGEIGERSEE